MLKKYLSLVTLVFYLLGFCTFPRYAEANPLALLAPAAIGAAVIAIGGTQYAFKGDHSASSYQFDGRNLTLPLVAYKKFAAQGAEILLGRSVTAVLDAKKAFDDNVLQSYSSLAGIIQDYFQDPGSTPLPAPGDVLGDPVGSGSCPANLGVTSVNYSTFNCLNTAEVMADPGYCHYGNHLYNPYNGRIFVHVGECSSTKMKVHLGYASPTTEDSNYPSPSPIPGVLNPSDVPGLSGDIIDALPSNPDVQKDLDQLLKDHPEYWPFSGSVGALPEPNNDIADYPPAQPITPSDVLNYIGHESAAANGDYISALEDLVAANPTDTGLQQALEQAQADAIKDDLQHLEKENDLSVDVPALQSAAIKAVDFSPITQLSGTLSQTFPFGLITQLMQGLSVLSAPAQAPSFTIDGGFFQQEVTLGVFDSLAAFVRAVMGFGLYCLTAVMVVRLFARM